MPRKINSPGAGLMNGLACAGDSLLAMARVMPNRVIRIFACVMALAWPLLGAAKQMDAGREAQISAICDAAAQRVAADVGVPLDVMRAITRTETGRTRNGALAPWPWTVNMEGAGKWFSNEAEAQSYVAQHFQRGARSFDVGCFQINYKWHHQAFDSIDQMFDPVANARYAAHFLRSLHDEFGDWSKAAGAYHSRTPKYANRYVARFKRIRASLEPVTTFAALPNDRFGANRARPRAVFTAPRPLVSGHQPTPLVAPPSGAGAARLGSLVPLSGASGRSLIAYQ